MNFKCKNTAIYNIRSRVHLACDDALPTSCEMHILIHNFRNSKDFSKVDFIAYSQLEGKHDADVEYFDLSQSCWQAH